MFNQASAMVRCLDSILNQTLRDLEVILVNNGSTDQSLAICRNYEVKDPRVRVINLATPNVSLARNAGLEAAQGEFIGFVDSDDWIEPDMMESMVDLCQKTGSQVCLCNFLFEQETRSTPVAIDITKQVLDRDEIFNHLILNMLAPDPARPYQKEITGSVFRILAKKDLFDQTSLRFDPEIGYMEDLIFTVRLLLSIDRLCLDQGLMYHYMVTGDSASKQHRKNLFVSLLDVINLLETALQEGNRYNEALPRLNYRLANTAIRSIINIVHESNPNPLTKKIAQIDRIVNYTKLQTILPALEIDHLNASRSWVITAIQQRRSRALYLYFKVNKHFLDPTPPQS